MIYISSIFSKKTFSGVKPDLKDADVKKLISTMIEKDIFLSAKGSLVALSGAQITQREVKKLNIK